MTDETDRFHPVPSGRLSRVARKLRAEQMADKERVAESKISDAVLKATTPDNID